MIRIIFMIDDDDDDRGIFQDAILKCNPDIDLLFAKDGIEALDMLNSRWVQPDVIFLDYNMPRMNGVECLKELKGDTRFKDIPVVMYTTSSDHAHEKMILGLGASCYMRKTHNLKQLCSELNRLLDDISQGIAQNRSRHNPNPGGR